MVIKKPNNRTLGLSWPTITKTDLRPCIQTTTSVQQGVSQKIRLKHFCCLKLATHFMSSQTRSKKISPKNKKDLGMAYHTSPLKKVKKQGEMPLPILDPIPSLNSTFFFNVIGWVMAFPLVSSLHTCILGIITSITTRYFTKP